MSPRLLAQVVAGSRVVIGLTLLAAPTLITQHWVGEDDAGRPGARVLAMGLGVRDLVVGAGVLAALSQGGDAAKPWLLGSTVADLGDLIAAVRHAGDLPNSAVGGTVVVAGAAATTGAWLLTQDL
jgi:hypothetical protein